MRTSGRSGAEGWMVVIPVLALMVALSMSNDGPRQILTAAERTIRETVTTAANWILAFF